MTTKLSENVLYDGCNVFRGWNVFELLLREALNV